MEHEASQPQTVSIWATGAASWQIDGNHFSITADISEVVSRFGPGIYSVEVPSGATLMVSSFALPFSLATYPIFVH